MGNPVRYEDPEGDACIPCAIVGAIAEATATAYDAYDAYQIVTDSKTSTVEKVVAVVGAAAGTVLPGGGYGKAGKAVVNALDGGKKMEKLRESAEIGQEAHRQIQKQLKDADPATEIEQIVKLGDNKEVRKDAIKPDGTMVIIKPDTPSGEKSAKAREKLMQKNGHRTEIIRYDPKNPAYQKNSPTYIVPKNKKK